MEAHPCEKESFIDKLWRYVNEIDFVAQKKVDRFCQTSQLLVCLLSFALSYFYQSFQICVLAQFIWALVLLVFTMFGCPYLKTNELEWLPAEIPKQYRIEEEDKRD
uniref:Microsomal signal peptidase 12 kDa subunit n=1 Tax=Strombidium rassoulzadegani TaxID=1082188 RepID=A0A7S3FSR2_9SPIT|mmetsp:Transcript_14367/g.24461  ORF Transcript_14367/g.24461 Transcript_14367/m.24461 type:complete len:106 (+) Transcript_14367:22-339(+)